jgi:hypothetical protein
MEMASKMPCQCQHTTASTASTAGSTCTRTCHCQPVALLRFDPHGHRFPLPCHPVQRQKQQQQGQATHQTTWTKHSLRKIQVHHAINLQSCLKFLLALQGRPLHQQPFGAIVLDDMDCLDDNHNKPTNNNDYPSRFLSQVLAICMDTINYLHLRPAVVCITINSTKTKLSPTSYAAAFLNAAVTLQEDSSKRASWNRICQENKASLCGSWTATSVPRGVHEAKKSTGYAVVCNETGSFSILWGQQED